MAFKGSENYLSERTDAKAIELDENAMLETMENIEKLDLWGGDDKDIKNDDDSMYG